MLIALTLGTRVNSKASGVAVVINDMIKGGLERLDDPQHNALVRASGVIDKTRQLVDSARASGVPVIWIRVERRPDRRDIVDNATDRPMGWHLPTVVSADTWESDQVSDLPVLDSDQVVLKPRLDPFQGTDLDLQLRAHGVRTILLAGHSTNMGVESCARTGHDLGYDVVVVRDCCFNASEKLHRFSLEEILPFFSRVLSLDEVVNQFLPEPT